MSHILIVDQIVHRRKVHHRLIKMIEPDIKVEEFDEPHEALDWLQTHSTDLMLLAMQMRGMSGVPPHMMNPAFQRACRCDVCGSLI